MPHVKNEIRESLDSGKTKPLSMGELAYVIADACNEYVAGAPQDINFQRIGEVLGAIESAKAEFIRNVHEPYETHKARVNGNVFEEARFEVERVTR